MNCQRNYTSLTSTLPLFNILLDTTTINKFFGHNFSNLTQHKTTKNSLSVDGLNYQINSSGNNTNRLNTYSTYKLFPQKLPNSQFLQSEKTVKLLKNLNTNNYKRGITPTLNLIKLVSDRVRNYITNTGYICLNLSYKLPEVLSSTISNLLPENKNNECGNLLSCLESRKKDSKPNDNKVDNCRQNSDSYPS